MMSTLRSFFLNSRSGLALGVVLALGVAAGLDRWSPTTHAQEQQQARSAEPVDEFSPEVTTVTPAMQLQYASIVGTGSTVTISRVPVTTSTGAIVYEDITTQFAVGANGQITNAAGYPKFVTSPTLPVANFKAGIYNGPNFGTNNNSYNGMQIAVAGPGIASGGATEWTLTTTSAATATCTYPPSATWYVGSPTSTNNPLAARLKAAEITSTAYSYGTVGNGNDNCGPNYAWYSNALIGVSQVGNTLTFTTFTYQNSDRSSPVDQVTYTLKQ
jgi:hypothetical protein